MNDIPPPVAALLARYLRIQATLHHLLTGQLPADGPWAALAADLENRAELGDDALLACAYLAEQALGDLERYAPAQPTAEQEELHALLVAVLDAAATLDPVVGPTLRSVARLYGEESYV